MIATPDYDRTVTELGDPIPVLGELSEAVTHDPPRINDAPSATDAQEVEPA